jgi:membrane-associated phospholipid phosphatase
VKRFFSTLPRNLLGCFTGRRIVWHVLAIVLTFALVTSGFDWRYYQWTRSPQLHAWMFPAVHIGGLLPIVLPLALFAIGVLPETGRIRRAAWAIAQAEIIGGIIAAGYKALTGRAHPMHSGSEDLTHIFHFGILRGGVFWGWPSSHTTIAFAMASAVFTLVPNRRWLRYLAVAYAFYVGIGVSMTIHWFSDFVAGALVGTLVGVVVGEGFLPTGSASQTKDFASGPLNHS